jgi:hypothetical protein
MELKKSKSINWNELVALSEELKAFIPAFPTSLAKEWKRPTLISTNKRYYFVALNLEGITLFYKLKFMCDHNLPYFNYGT